MYRLRRPQLAWISAYGKRVREAQLASAPEALSRWSGDQQGEKGRPSGAAQACGRNGYIRGCAAGQAVVLMGTRQANGALKAMPMTGRRDAAGLARLLNLSRLGSGHLRAIRATKETG